MINKMYTIMDQACEKASKLTGVSIKFPRPSKRSLKFSMFMNGVLGIGFTLFGIFSTYKWTILLGILGLISSYITSQARK